MVNFKIDLLAFTSCNRKYVTALCDILPSNVVPPNGTIIVHVAFLVHSTRTELVNCFFHDNLGTVLVVNNTNITLAGTTFIHNNYHLEEFVCVSHCMSGGAVTAIHSNLIFTGNTTFLENGAIYFRNSTSFPGFYWGAIFTYINTVINFNGTSNFINNTAAWGGAIYAFDDTIINFNATSNFINNSADYSGGAIFTNNNTVINFNGTSKVLLSTPWSESVQWY